MRILQLNFEDGWRGGERQTLLCLKQCVAAGHDAVLLARRGAQLAERASAEGIAVVEVGSLAGVMSFLLRRGRSFDVLHAQTANMMTWLAVLKPWLGKRIVFTRRTAFAVTHRQMRTSWKWRKADAFVAISQMAAQEPRRLGIEPMIIPSAIEARPVDEAHVEAVAHEFGLRGQRVLATAASLTRDKDPCTLVRAVHALRQRRDDFIFLHFGAGGDAEAVARALVAELQLDDVYKFAGFRAGMEDLYRLMDVFVSAPREEALGTSVLDALLYSVPVVSTNAGGLKESLAQGRGLLCDVGDYEALAAGMQRVLSEPALRAGMVERALDYVRREHDAGVMGRRYLKVYEEVVSG